jgi:hypothetical protein
MKGPLRKIYFQQVVVYVTLSFFAIAQPSHMTRNPQPEKQASEPVVEVFLCYPLIWA